MSSCTPPPITIPNPVNLMSAIVSFLEGLSIPIPSIPTIPMPHLFCPLD